MSGELSAAASLSPPPGSPSAVLFTPLVSAVAGAAAGAGGGNGGGRPTVAVQMGGCGRAGPQAATRQAFYIMAISAWQYIRLFIHTEMYSLSAMRGVGTLSRERGRLCPLESGRQLWRQRAQSMSPSAACSGDPDRRACEERPKHGNCCNRNLEHFTHRQRVNNEPKRTGM